MTVLICQEVGVLSVSNLFLNLYFPYTAIRVPSVLPRHPELTAGHGRSVSAGRSDDPDFRSDPRAHRLEALGHQRACGHSGRGGRSRLCAHPQGPPTLLF